VDEVSPPGTPVIQPASDAKKDEKSSAPSIASFKLGSIMSKMKSGVKKGKGKGRLESYRCKTFVRDQSSGSSATLYAPVLVLQPNATSVTEATNFAALFDEARCLGVTVYGRVEGINANGAWAFAFDPGNSSGYASVGGVLLATQNSGPMAFNASTSTSLAPVVVSPTGYVKKHFKTFAAMPTAGASVPNEIVGNGWFACSDVNAVVGYVKICVDAFTAMTPMVDFFLIYHMEYRSRT